MTKIVPHLSSYLQMHGTVFHIEYISIDIDSPYSKIASCCLPYYFLLFFYLTSIPSSFPPEESYHLLDDLDVLPGIYLNNLLPILSFPFLLLTISA